LRSPVDRFRAGIWNIGAEGQMYMEHIRHGLAIHFHEAGASGCSAMIVAGALGGAAVASSRRLLRAQLHANEILVSLNAHPTSPI